MTENREQTIREQTNHQFNNRGHSNRGHSNRGHSNRGHSNRQHNNRQHYNHQHNNRQTQSRDERSRAAMIALVTKENYQIIAQEFPNLAFSRCEARGFLGVEVTKKTEFYSFVRSVLSEIPKVVSDEEIDCAFKNESGQRGIGINFAAYEILKSNWQRLQQRIPEDESLYLISIVERGNIKFGYPNLDAVCSTGYGKVDKNEDSMDTAIRETLEESGINLSDAKDQIIEFGDYKNIKFFLCVLLKDWKAELVEIKPEKKIIYFSN